MLFKPTIWLKFASSSSFRAEPFTYDPSFEFDKPALEPFD